MNGKKFKRLLKINGLTQEDAAKIFNVSRETISRWCQISGEIPQKAHKIVKSEFRIKDVDFSETSINGNGNIANHGDINNSGTIDLRSYNSDSPDVLRAQIDLLEERIKEKDAQIKEKDAQINKLLEILSKK